MNPRVERACKEILESLNGLDLAEAVFLLAAMITQLASENDCKEDDVIATVKSAFRSKALIKRSAQS